MEKTIMQMNRRKKPLQILDEAWGFIVVGATLLAIGKMILEIIT